MVMHLWFDIVMSIIMSRENSQKHCSEFIFTFDSDTDNGANEDRLSKTIRIVAPSFAVSGNFETANEIETTEMAVRRNTPAIYCGITFCQVKH